MKLTTIFFLLSLVKIISILPRNQKISKVKQLKTIYKKTDETNGGGGGDIIS